MEIEDEIIQEFRVSAFEMLEDSETRILELEKGAALKLHYGEIFKVFHSLKGAAGMVGFETVTNVIHEMEDQLKPFEGKEAIESNVLEYFLEKIDHVRKLLNGESVEPSDPQRTHEKNGIREESPIEAKEKIIGAEQTRLGMAKVLVVDDEAGALKLVKIMLGKDYHISTAESVEQALALFKSNEFQALVTDIKMPKVSGLELLRYMTNEYPDTPVIIMTGHADKTIAIDSMNLGAFYFLEKPFDRNEIIKALRKAMYKRAKNYISEGQKLK